MGGATFAGSYVLRRYGSRPGPVRVALTDVKDAAAEVYSETKSAVHDLASSQLGQAVGRRGRNAQSAFRRLNETEIIPLRKAAKEEWEAFSEVFQEDEADLIRNVKAARRALGSAAAKFAANLTGRPPA